jgi:hypothetical protein
MRRFEAAVAGTGRIGIAPQGPKTARIVEVERKDPADPAKKIKAKEWGFTTAQWHEALGKVGFDGLIKIALDRLTRDLGLSTPLAAGDIHVAGHSAGGQGIVESITQGSRTKTLADQVQDITLQDAGYGDTWSRAVDWLLDGSPGKTMRVLLSHGEGGRGATRKVLADVNAASVKAAITEKKKDADLEVVEQPVPAPKDQKPRPGGFVLESHFIVKSKKTGAPQGTVVVFFAPFAPMQGHYETATATMRAAAVVNDVIISSYDLDQRIKLASPG